MTENLESMKGFFPITCSGCGKQMYAELETAVPVIKKIFSLEDVKEAKKMAIEKIKSMGLEPDILWKISSVISSEDTIFTPDDVDAAVEQILVQNN